jgi:prevent-host-death family protein
VGKTISATDARRNFSRLLREVDQGQSCILTSRGQAIVQITPVTPISKSHGLAARTRLLKRLRTQAVTDIGQWTRGEHYQ